MSEQATQTEPAPERLRYTADHPQRYTVNYPHYLSLGGPVRLDEFVAGFTAGGTNRGDMARFYFFCLVFDQLVKEGLAGDLAELGTYKGHTATMLATIARKLGRSVYLLDTFEGFSKQDLTGLNANTQATAFSDTSLEEVRALVGEENVRYLKGYFPDTSVELPSDGRYCLVHIDCDLYAPIRDALAYFYPRMVPGGFMIVHDYSSLYWSGGPEKAVDEFFADKTECVMPLPDSAGTAVIRKARSADGRDDWMLRRRTALLREDWATAADGKLKELLGAGWSGPESWGVWGVGPSHELRLALAAALPAKITLELDVHVALVGGRTSQLVQVEQEGQRLATWKFTTDRNRAVRSVSIPIAGHDRHALCGVSVELRPQSCASPAELDPSLTERRPLGLALHRIRRTQ